MKLPLREPEQAALRRGLRQWYGLVSSTLLGVEARRACARYGPRYVRRVDEALAGTSLVSLDDAVVEIAAGLQPPELRSLDAIHPATALSLGRDLGAMYVYDPRLAEAARAAGVRVEAPT